MLLRLLLSNEWYGKCEGKCLLNASQQEKNSNEKFFLFLFASSTKQTNKKNKSENNKIFDTR